MGYDVANRKMMFLALLTESVRIYRLILQVLHMAVAYPLCHLFGLGMFLGVSWIIRMLMDHLGSLQKFCLPRQESVLSNESIYSVFCLLLILFSLFFHVLSLI